MRGERERVADRVRDLLGVPRPDESGRHRFRWDPGWRGTAALGLVLIAAVGVTVWWVASSHSESVPVTPLGSPAGVTAGVSGSAPVALSVVPSAGQASSASSPSAAAGIVVDVAGKVVRPGIYRLPAGARVYDAVHAAGGARPGVDTVSINLAAPLQDGQQVVVGESGAPTQPAAVSGVATTGAAPAVVDVNTATLEQLETLPGIGPVLGQKILDWRSEHGQFNSVDQLNEVSGIGEVKFAGLKDLVSV